MTKSYFDLELAREGGIASESKTGLKYETFEKEIS